MTWRPVCVGFGIALGLASCAPEIHYDRASVEITGTSLRLRISAPGVGERRKHCAPALGVVATFNGVRARTITSGGGEPFPDSDTLGCEALEFEASFDPGSTDHVDIGFEGRDANQVADWHIAAAWTRVWTDDDIQAALLAGDAFEVQWMPADSPAPIVISTSSGKLEELERTPGRLRYRFAAPPIGPWSVDAIYAQSDGDITTCEGFKGCSLRMPSRFHLTPEHLPAP